MMSRRTLFKLLALVPWAGPAVAKALAQSPCPPAPVFVPYLPATFPEWNPAIDGLSDAGKWVLDIERSRLPAGMVVPLAGQVWGAVRDCQVEYRAHLGHPIAQADPLRLSLAYLGPFGVALLRQGEQVRILSADDPRKPLRVSFQPVRYHELQDAIVSAEVRNTPGYSGYELSARTARTIAWCGEQPSQVYFNEAFRLVQEAALHGTAVSPLA